MKKAYSQDLRERALEAFYSGKPIQEICSFFKISSRCLLTWRRIKERTGRTCVKSNYQKESAEHKIAKQELEKFKKFVNEKADRTTSEMAKEWGNVSASTIQRALRRIRFTRKKRPMDIKREAKVYE